MYEMNLKCVLCLRFALMRGLTLILGFLISHQVFAACGAEPTVWMDESTAASHLLSRRDIEVPTALPIARLQEVKLQVTVDREGTICEVLPLTAPKELREAAAKIVRDHWRYRRFLVDWNPVVVQFPVTVKSLPVKRRTQPLIFAEESSRRPRMPRA